MEVLRLVLLFIECLKIKITKEMSENCRVYWLYLITTWKYKSNKIWSLKHTFEKKKNRRMRILGACIFLSFLAGKLRHFNRMLLTTLPKKRKKVWRMRILNAPYFLSFLAGKLKTSLRDVTWFLNDKKNGGQLLVLNSKHLMLTSRKDVLGR